MTTSHLLGLIMFGMMTLFGILSWVLSNKHPSIAGDPVMVRKARRWAILCPVLGAMLGYGAFALDNSVAVTTLYEAMAEGSVGLAPESPAPVRTLLFEVEHPGVEHDLLVDPVPKRLRFPRSPQKFRSRSTDPPGKRSFQSERSVSPSNAIGGTKPIGREKRFPSLPSPRDRTPFACSR